MNRSYDSVVALLSRNLHTPKALSKNNRFRFSSQRRYKQTLTKSDRGAHAIVGKNIRRTNEKSLMNGDGSYLYGLKPVDFSIPPSIHISPPPPPSRCALCCPTTPPVRTASRHPSLTSSRSTSPLLSRRRKLQQQHNVFQSENGWFSSSRARPWPLLCCIV